MTCSSPGYSAASLQVKKSATNLSGIVAMVVYSCPLKNVSEIVVKVVNTVSEVISVWLGEQNISVPVNTGIPFKIYH